MDNIARRNFIKVLGGFAITSLAGCASDEQLGIYEQINNLAFKNGRDSYFDDVLVSHQNIEVHTFHNGNLVPLSMSLVDATNMMEKSIMINKLFDEYGLGFFDDRNLEYVTDNFPKDNNEINQLEFDLINCSYDEVKQLLADLNDASLTEIQKTDCQAKIEYLREYYSVWHIHNNSRICSELLLALLKSYTCQAANLDLSYYDSVRILPDNNIVIENDKVVQTYTVDETSGMISACLESLYECQSNVSLGVTASGYLLTGDEKKAEYDRTIEDAIFNLKCGIVCGVKEEDGVLRQGVELTEDLLREVSSRTL